MNSRTDVHTNNVSYLKEPSESKTKGWTSWLLFFVVATALYFGNVELQTFLGERALAKVDFPALTLEQAIEKAKASNKLVLADMSAIWCPSCRKLDTQVLSNSDVKNAIDENYVFVRIEYESEAGKAFQQRYNVTGFPTLLVLNTNGEKVRNLGLTFDAEDFIQRL